MAKEELISLQVDKDLVAPIVEKHLKLAIIEAFGGSDEIIKTVISQILNKRVDVNGNVNSYSSENKYSWIDIALKKHIEDAVRKELADVMSKSTEKIKNALISKLKSDKGANAVADALLEGLAGTFKNSWTSKFEIKIEPIRRD
jgi:ERCC4-related helicase